MAEDSGEQEPRKRPAPPPVEFLRPGEEQAPLPPRDQTPAAWVPRPEDFRQPTGMKRPPSPTGIGPNLPRIAGILLLVSAVVGMAGSIYGAVHLPSVAQYADFTRNNSPLTLAEIQICGLVSIWAQAMALLGGVMAFQRMNWKLTFVCALASLATFGFFYLEASVIGAVALLVTVRARPYFLS
jgi:hypothetical protein